MRIGDYTVYSACLGPQCSNNAELFKPAAIEPRTYHGVCQSHHTYLGPASGRYMSLEQVKADIAMREL